jgi:hypothetical protein
MRWTVLILFIFSCVREVYKEVRVDFPEKTVEKLTNGFEFIWIVKRETPEIKSTFNASGVYRGENDFDLKGTIKIEDKEEPIFEIDPYIEIKNLTGKKDFKLVSQNKDKFTYSFTANLSLFSPGGKEGEGLLIIDKEWVNKITAKANGINWEMNVIPVKQPERKSIKIEDNIDRDIIKKRFEYYGERKVEIKGNYIYFEEAIPIDKNGLLFKEGDYSIYSIDYVPEGELLLSPDSIEYYNPIKKLKTDVKDVQITLDERGRHWITIEFTKPVKEFLVGIIIDDELFGIGHPSGLSLRFNVKYNKLAREIYAVLKAQAEKTSKP